jgi:hypothetical protein
VNVAGIGDPVAPSPLATGPLVTGPDVTGRDVTGRDVTGPDVTGPDGVVAVAGADASDESERVVDAVAGAGGGELGAAGRCGPPSEHPTASAGSRIVSRKRRIVDPPDRTPTYITPPAWTCRRAPGATRTTGPFTAVGRLW